MWSGLSVFLCRWNSVRQKATGGRKQVSLERRSVGEGKGTEPSRT